MKQTVGRLRALTPPVQGVIYGGVMVSDGDSSVGGHGLLGK